MIVFGADQLQEASLTSRALDKFVVVLQAAAMFWDLAEAFLLKPHYDYFTFYVIGLSMLAVAILLFALGWRYYVHVRPYDSVVTNCFPVYKNALHVWRQSRRENHRVPIRNIDDHTAETLDASNGFATDTMEESVGRDERTRTFLDNAKVVNNGKFLDRIVDDVKSLQIALIIYFIFVFPYRLISNQVN